MIFKSIVEGSTLQCTSKDVETTLIDEIIEKLELGEFKKMMDDQNVKHPLRKILSRFDADILGRSLDSFMYVRNRDWAKVNGLEYIHLKLYHKISSDPRFVNEKCPDEFRDTLVD